MAVKKRLSLKERLRILELAATGYYDSPKEAVARARAYEAFVYGEVPKKGKKPAKSLISNSKPLMVRVRTKR